MVWLCCVLAIYLDTYFHLASCRHIEWAVEPGCIFLLRRGYPVLHQLADLAEGTVTRFHFLNMCLFDYVITFAALFVVTPNALPYLILHICDAFTCVECSFAGSICCVSAFAPAVSEQAFFRRVDALLP